MVTKLNCRTNKNLFLKIVWVTVLAVVTLNSACAQSLQTNNPVKYLGDIEHGFLSTIVWSPDGEKIAATTYHSYDNYSTIYLFDVETGKFQQVLKTSWGPITAVGWSPDRKRLLLYSDDEGKEFKPGIWILDLDGASTTQFVSEGSLAAWSFDGNQLAIFKTVQGSPVWDIELHTLDLNSYENRVVYRTRGKYLYGLSWSPDGTHLAFALAQEEQPEVVNIYTLNIANGEVKQLTTSGKNASPTWSPKGNLIAYVTEDGSSDAKLSIQRPDGGCSTDVLNIKYLSSPSWSPDGRSIAFVGTSGGIYQIDLVKMFGPQFLLDGPECS